MLPKRCSLALGAAACLNGACLLSVSGGLGDGVRLSSILAMLGVAACVTAAASVVVRPLGRDLERLLALVGRAEDTIPDLAGVTAACAESSALLAGLALLQARSAELEAVERDARRAIEEAERLRVSFVAAMGHDLRGPLNSVMGFADLLVMPEQDPVGPLQRGSVDLIRRSAQDLLVVIEQILDWAKLEAGQLVLSKREVSPQELIAEAVKTAVARSADRGLVVEHDVAAELPALNADARRLSQALLALMDHATRAPSQPRVTLRVRVAPAERASDGHAAGARCLRIELRDPQLEVREADQGEFFEAFRPSYAPSGRRVSGLGLGPALARALIRAHGGQVWFESHADTGTTFIAELPLSATAGA
ncbi:MAG: sensor histidine kinase [Polyangiales bacterium]